MGEGDGCTKRIHPSREAGVVRLLNGFDELLERLRLRASKFGENLAVELDGLLLQRIDEYTVGCTELAKCSVEANSPEIASGALLQLAANVGLHAGLEHSGLCKLGELLAAPLEAFGLLEQLCALCLAHGSTFDSWHISSMKGSPYALGPCQQGKEGHARWSCASSRSYQHHGASCASGCRYRGS